MRVLFAGTPAAAVPSLQALVDSPRHEVVGVLTRPDAPAGRGRAVRRSPVAERADASGIPVHTPRRPGDADFVATLTELAPDCAPVVAYGALLPARILYLPRYGWINLHFSLLPAWRGAAPVQHTILAGDEITGASTFLIEEGLDTGPVFGVTTDAVRPSDTAGDLLERLSIAGAGLLTATLDALDDAEIAPRDQAEDGVSFAPKLTTEDARIDFATAATAIDRRIRACTPAPGAWTLWRGERLKLGPVRLSTGTVSGAATSNGGNTGTATATGSTRGDDAGSDSGGLAAGQLQVHGGDVVVGTATQPVLLSTVQPAGKKAMPAVDWARGAHLTADERLG